MSKVIEDALYDRILRALREYHYDQFQMSLAEALSETRCEDIQQEIKEIRSIINQLKDLEE